MKKQGHKPVLIFAVHALYLVTKFGKPVIFTGIFNNYLIERSFHSKKRYCTILIFHKLGLSGI
jgi:hypothetical protein